LPTSKADLWPAKAERSSAESATRGRERLAQDFAAKKQSNTRYSLRAFSALLGADHSTVSQVMRGTRRATVPQLRAWARKLAIPPEEITVLLAAEQAPDPDTAKRQAMLLHWTAEAQAVVRDSVHLRFCGSAEPTTFAPTAAGSPPVRKPPWTR
jgi:transcriptional regulator with XRE-family HTH domain